MNPYFHSFMPGFNLWYLVGPLTIVLTSILAWCLPTLQNGRVSRTNFTAGTVLAMVIGSALIFTTMLFVESGAGAIQFFDNMLTTSDSPVWSLFLAGFAIVFVGIIHFCANFFLAVFVCKRKITALKIQARKDAAKKQAGTQRKNSSW